RGGDGLGIAPAGLFGDAAEEVEGSDHAGQDGLGALERQRQDEGCVGIGPGGDQERNEPPSVGKVDMDVTEIGLEALAWEMSQGDERLAMVAAVFEQVALDLAVTSAVAVLVLEAPKQLHGGVALLGRRLLVVGPDLVDEPHDGTQDGSGPISGRGT